MNYFDDGYVIDDLFEVRSTGADIEIDWLLGTFEPKERVTPRIAKSINHYRDSLGKHLESNGVTEASIKQLFFRWPVRGRKYMFAVDDRGKEHKIYVREYK